MTLTEYKLWDTALRSSKHYSLTSGAERLAGWYLKSPATLQSKEKQQKLFHNSFEFGSADTLRTLVSKPSCSAYLPRSVLSTKHLLHHLCCHKYTQNFWWTHCKSKEGYLLLPGFDDEPRRGSAVVFNPHKATLVFCSNNLINRWLIWFLCVTANLKHEEDVLIVGVKSQKSSTCIPGK